MLVAASFLKQATCGAKSDGAVLVFQGREATCHGRYLCKHVPMMHQQQSQQSNACTKYIAVLPAGIQHMCWKCGVSLLTVYVRLVQCIASKAVTTSSARDRCVEQAQGCRMQILLNPSAMFTTYCCLVNVRPKHAEHKGLTPSA